MPVPSLAGAQLTAASRSAAHDFIGAGTSDGRVAMLQVHFVPRYEEQRLADLDVSIEERGIITLDEGKRPVLDLDYQESESQRAVAARVADDEILLYLRSESDGAEQRDSLKTRDGERDQQAAARPG
jgi:hypothetical protein